MNMQQLQYFQAMAEYGQATKAAKILHVSQPTLSMSLSNLEAEIGVALFEKNGRTLDLTNYGRVFLKHISIALQEIELAKSEVVRLHHSESKTLRISSTFSLGFSLIPELIKSFTALNPDTVFHLKQGPNLELIKGLVKSEADFVFGRILPEVAAHPNLKYVSLYSEELVLLINKNHPLAHYKEVDMEELKEESFIFFHESTGYNIIVTALLETLSYKPKIRYEVYDNSTCLALVSSEQGIALAVPSPSYDHSTICQIKIKTPSNFNQTETYLIWNGAAQKQAPIFYNNFLDFVCDKYR